MFASSRCRVPIAQDRYIRTEDFSTDYGTACRLISASTVGRRSGGRPSPSRRKEKGSTASTGATNQEVGSVGTQGQRTRGLDMIPGWLLHSIVFDSTTTNNGRSLGSNAPCPGVRSTWFLQRSGQELSLENGRICNWTCGKEQEIALTIFVVVVDVFINTCHLPP